MEYAIIKTGGKQYQVIPGETVDVEKLPVEQGSLIELDNVLAISKKGKIRFGSPTLKGAKVVAELTDQAKDDKITVFKFKPKTRYSVKKGHRRAFTRLKIREILSRSTRSKDGS